jgi:hypothetical protein
MRSRSPGTTGKWRAYTTGTCAKFIEQRRSHIRRKGRHPTRTVTVEPIPIHGSVEPRQAPKPSKIRDAEFPLHDPADRRRQLYV